MNTLSLVEVERLISNRLRGGYAEEQSRRLLGEILSAHSGVNLESALAYHGFGAL